VRPLKNIPLIAAVAFAVIATPASAAGPRPIPVKNLLAGPVISGADLVYVDQPRGKTARLRRIRPGGRARTIRSFPKTTSASVAASRVGYAVMIHTGRSRRVVYGGLVGKNRLKVINRDCSDSDSGPFADTRPEVAVSGARVAFVRDSCRGGDRRVVVKDLRTGRTDAIRRASYTAVAFAGDFVAYHDAEDPALLFVYNLRTGTVAYGISQDDVDGADIQADGTLVVGSLFPSSSDDVVWYSWGDQRRHYLQRWCYDGTQTAIDAGRIACAGYGELDQRESVVVTDLRGKVRARIVVGRELTRNIDLVGPRVAYATDGCGKGKTNLWLVVHTKKRLPSAAASACGRQ
jgi:hypothetical protein